MNLNVRERSISIKRVYLLLNLARDDRHFQRSVRQNTKQIINRQSKPARKKQKKRRRHSERSQANKWNQNKLQDRNKRACTATTTARKRSSSVPFSQAMHWCDECSCLCIHFKINSNLSDWKQHDNSSLDDIFHTFHKWFWIHKHAQTHAHTCAATSFVYREFKIKNKKKKRLIEHHTMCHGPDCVRVCVSVHQL